MTLLQTRLLSQPPLCILTSDGAWGGKGGAKVAGSETARRIGAGWGAVGAAVVGLTVLPAAAQGSFPGDNGHIAFYRADGSDQEIFGIDPVTSDEEQLTDN